MIFVDVTPDVLRQRLRDGKIYPRERIDAALGQLLPRREPRRAARARGARAAAARARCGGAPRRSRASCSERHRASATCSSSSRMTRLARRLGVELQVVTVPSGEGDAATRLVGMLDAGDVLAVESPRRRRPLVFGKRSFAVRALAAGARELLVLAPRTKSEVVADAEADRVILPGRRRRREGRRRVELQLRDRCRGTRRTRTACALRTPGRSRSRRSRSRRRGPSRSAARRRARAKERTRTSAARRS